MIRSDVFILMDNAQIPKKGGSWANRVNLYVGGDSAWVTMPVDRSYHGVRPIHQVAINNQTPWRKKLLATITTNYGKAPYFREVFPFVRDLIGYEAERLADFNVHAIRAVLDRLGLPHGRLVLGSTLEAEGSATNLLINMVRAVGGTAYMCGGGAEGYQEDEMFECAGIELIYQAFKHPEYAQRHGNTFVPGLSILDALFNLGFEESSGLLSDPTPSTEEAGV